MAENKTIAEKIFSKTAEHDVSGHYEIMKDKEKSRVWDPSKIMILFDHQIPADSLNAAQTHAPYHDTP